MLQQEHKQCLICGSFGYAQSYLVTKETFLLDVPSADLYSLGGFENKESSMLFFIRYVQ